MPQDKTHAFLSGGAETGALIRAFDWTETPIGSPSAWPQPCKTLMSVMLSSNQPMFLLWGAKRTLLYNDAYRGILGIKHPAALGQDFLDVWREARDDLQPLVAQVFGGESVQMDHITLLVNRRGRMEESHFAFSYTPVHDTGGNIAGLFCACQDTTHQVLGERALAAAKDAAEEANLAKSTFIANMSHELRTPLSAIIGYSEMLLEEIEDGVDAAELLEDMRKIESNARHLLGLINDVLDLSKIESGRMEVFAETFDVSATLHDVAVTVDALFAKKNNRFALKSADTLGVMHSDVTKVRQILLNLLSNAAKFTDGGTVTLSARREGGSGPKAKLVFEVEDTGIGMTADQLAQLFQRFRQADASTTRKFGGTGLGLSITKAFADMLGGTVSVDSRHGTGSTFTVTLPALLAEAPGDPAADAQAPAGTAHRTPDARREIVLVIDDDPPSGT